MAINIDCFISSLTPDPATGRELIACCHKHGIEQAINLAVLSSEDLGVLCEGSSEATFVLAAAAQAAASRLTEGWARGSSLRAERALSEAVRASNAQSAPPAPLPLDAPRPSTASSRRVESSVAAVTTRLLTGFLPDTPIAVEGIRNTASTREAQMAKAIRCADEVFQKYAHDSSRARALAASSETADWLLHRATYIGSCTAAKSVRLRYQTADCFFRHCERACGGFMKATEFQVAAWASAFARRGKTTGKTARAALLWVEAVTGESVFARSPLVTFHCNSTRLPGMIREKPQAAKPPDVEVLRRFEHLITLAPTAVQRCVAGFLTLLAFSSSRTADLLRSRNLTLTRDSLTGESIMKQPKGVWVRWFAPRKGLVSDDWAGNWLDELNRCGLPGSDFVLTGVNRALDAWSPRMATYNDVKDVFRAMLCTQCGFSVAAAAELAPHGFRHILVSAGAQLRRQGFVDTRGLGTLGHWAPGSIEPEKYDSFSGVTELDTRHVILGAFRDGWAPAQEGELSTPFNPSGDPPRRAKVPLRRKHSRLARSVRPKVGSKPVQQLQGTSSQEPLSSTLNVPRLEILKDGTASTPTPPSSSWGAPTPLLPVTEAVLVPKAEQRLGDVPSHPLTRDLKRKRSMDPEPELPAGWHVVQHLISLKLHGVRVGADQTACTYWTCGTPETPALHADFSAVSSLDLDWCSRCSKKMGR